MPDEEGIRMRLGMALGSPKTSGRRGDLNSSHSTAYLEKVMKTPQTFTAYRLRKLGIFANINQRLLGRVYNHFNRNVVFSSGPSLIHICRYETQKMPHVEHGILHSKMDAITSSQLDAPYTPTTSNTDPLSALPGQSTLWRPTNIANFIVASPAGVGSFLSYWDTLSTCTAICGVCAGGRWWRRGRMLTTNCRSVVRV